MNYTPEQKKENVRKIRDFLASNSPPPKFDMISYTNDGSNYGGGLVPQTLHIYNECGTTACFAGHGPLAGIAPLENELWEQYAVRCFVDGVRTTEFEWLFASQWTYYEGHDTAEAAIARATVYLEDGVPKYFKCIDRWCSQNKP